MPDQADIPNNSDAAENGRPNTTDWFLQAIIETYVTSGVEMGLTLTIGGSVVSGLLISGKTYFRELKDFLMESSQQEGDIFETLANDFGALGPHIYDKPSDATDEWKPDPISFIHLKAARFHAPGQRGMPLKNGFLWRGRLEAVDAFSLGSFAD